MSSLPTGAPFERIAIDILDCRRKSRRGFQYILVVGDYFTKYMDAFPLRNHTARVVAEVLATRYFKYHGAPLNLHSDQGPEFESKLFKAFTSLYGVTKIRTSPYRPQSDGMVERLNRSLLNMLSAFVSDSAMDWDEHLPFAVQAYNSSVHSSTGITPHAMVYGHEMRLPVDLLFPGPVGAPLPACGPEYVDLLRRTIGTAHDLARAHLGKALIRQKRGYDAHAKSQAPFVVGDLVRYYYPVVAQCNKFARPWIGPFRVIEKSTEVDYKIAPVSGRGKTRVVHYDNLKPYIGDGDEVTDVVELPPLRDHSVASESDVPDVMADYIDPIDSGSEHVDIVPERKLRPRRELRKPQRFRSDRVLVRKRSVTCPTRDRRLPVATVWTPQCYLTMGES